MALLIIRTTPPCFRVNGTFSKWESLMPRPSQSSMGSQAGNGLRKAENGTGTKATRTLLMIGGRLTVKPSGSGMTESRFAVGRQSVRNIIISIRTALRSRTAGSTRAASATGSTATTATSGRAGTRSTASGTTPTPTARWSSPAGRPAPTAGPTGSTRAPLPSGGAGSTRAASATA